MEEASLLREKISALQVENDNLKANILTHERPVAGGTKNQQRAKIAELIVILEGRDIFIPANSGFGNSASSRTLLDIFILCRNDLVGGVSNFPGVEKKELFLFSIIAPKLHDCGLLQYEDVAGRHQRRAFVSRYGLEVLAACEQADA